jgi:hypothetical protein
MKKTIMFVSVAMLFGFAAKAQENPEFRSWAPSPPMGWNSWDCYGANVTEAEVKANADYMAERLKQHGWEYVVVDIRWFVENQHTGNYVSSPVYVLDEYGRYLPAVNRFPSAAGGAGFKPLADYVHSKGLKFGIHIMRGIPVKAVRERSPIKNAGGLTAADIYSTSAQCTWLPDNYTILAGKPGAQEYYNSIFELYASWGVDFIKIDDLSRPYHQGEIELIRNAIDNTGRPIVLSMSPGATPLEKAEHAQNHANMWRTVDDFWDTWSQLEHEFLVCSLWAPYIAQGAYPDADMLPLGRIDLRGNDRRTRFTRDEQYSLMSLFTIFKSPLMFGGNLPDNDDFTSSLLTNDEVLYMHKNSVNNRQLHRDNGAIAWAADDTASGDKFLALFFVGETGNFRTNQALHRTGSVTRATPGYGVDIDIPLSGAANDLYLVVDDCDASFTNDHADWISPTVFSEQGDSILLTDLEWESATTGWGTISLNKSVSGNALRVADKTFSNGIGTHANSVIHYILPEGYNHRFKAFAGLDRGGTDQEGGAVVEFFVFDADPTLRQVDPSKAVANSQKITRTLRKEGLMLEADITGAKKLYLVVTDAGDDFNYDHADWINPTIAKPDGSTTLLTSLSWVSATSGYGSVRKNKSLDNNTLTVNGVTYENGFGVNSYAYIEYDLPEGYTRFSSFCGLDDEVLNAPNGATVEFMVFTEEPRLNTTSQAVPVDMAALGFEGKVKVRDMWQKQDLGLYSEAEFAPVISYHGAGLFRLSAEGAATDSTATAATAAGALPAAVLSVHPNPTSGVVYVANEGNSEVALYTVKGELLLRSVGSAVDLSHLPSGVYVLKVGAKTAKVVKI